MSQNEIPYEQFAENLIEDITNNLKTTPLVHYGFVQYQKNNNSGSLVDRTMEEYDLGDFGLGQSVILSYCKIENPFQYARKLDYITEQFACNMALY